MNAMILPLVVRKKRRSPPKPAPKPRRRYVEPGHFSKGPPAHVVSEMGVVQEAELYFGKRITRRDGVRFLDGYYCDLDTLMKTYNAGRKKMGLDPVGRKPEWL